MSGGVNGPPECVSRPGAGLERTSRTRKGRNGRRNGSAPTPSSALTAAQRSSGPAVGRGGGARRGPPVGEALGARLRPAPPPGPSPPHADLRAPAPARPVPRTRRLHRWGMRRGVRFEARAPASGPRTSCLTGRRKAGWRYARRSTATKRRSRRASSPKIEARERGDRSMMQGFVRGRQPVYKRPSL